MQNKNCTSYLTAVGSPSNEKCSTMPPRTSNGTTGLKDPIWLGLNVNNTSTDCPGLMWSCDGEKWKCAVEWRENVSGKLADSLFTVQRASICSPTVQSPNLNTGLGEIESSTGKAVPSRATSTLEPRKELKSIIQELIYRQGSPWATRKMAQGQILLVWWTQHRRHLPCIS